MENNQSIGAIWIKQGQKGEYLSLSIEVEGIKRSYVAFKGKKKSEKSPDYYVMPPLNRREPASFYNDEGMPW